MGYAFLDSGRTKITAAEPFDSQGYLLHAVPGASPMVDGFHWMGQIGWFVEFANVAAPRGELLIGLGLLAGVLTRLAAFFGALVRIPLYFGNWSVEHGIINGDFAYAVVSRPVLASHRHRVRRGAHPQAGAVIERYEVGGKSLVERYPKLEYVLG